MKTQRPLRTPAPKCPVPPRVVATQRLPAAGARACGGAGLGRAADRLGPPEGLSGAAHGAAVCTNKPRRRTAPLNRAGVSAGAAALAASPPFSEPGAIRTATAVLKN